MFSYDSEAWQDHEDGDDDELVEVEISNVVRKTEDAFLVVANLSEEVWLPKSQIETVELEVGDEDVSVLIPAWLAKDRGLV